MHRNGNVIIFLKFASLPAPKVIIWLTANAACNKNFVKMAKVVSGQYWHLILSWSHSSCFKILVMLALYFTYRTPPPPPPTPTPPPHHHPTTPPPHPTPTTHHPPPHPTPHHPPPHPTTTPYIICHIQICLGVSVLIWPRQLSGWLSSL